MKKIFTLLLSSLFSLSLLANNGARLHISRVNSKMNLKIEVDGQRVKMQGDNVTLINLSEGNHNIRVYRALINNDFRNGYDKGYEIIYATSVYLGWAYRVEITINASGRVFMDSYRIEPEDDCYPGDNGSFGYSSGNDNIIEDGPNNSYVNVMSAREFVQLKEQIRKEWFEANRLISVKTIIDKNNFTTQQVMDLMLLFSLESNRMEVAKYAYCKIADKQNIYQLNGALMFSNSKDEMARFYNESH
jgi:hypothetical protein